jgi:hypothetical protein
MLCVPYLFLQARRARHVFCAWATVASDQLERGSKLNVYLLKRPMISGMAKQPAMAGRGTLLCLYIDYKKATRP